MGHCWLRFVCWGNLEMNQFLKLVMFLFNWFLHTWNEIHFVAWWKHSIFISCCITIIKVIDIFCSLHKSNQGNRTITLELNHYLKQFMFLLVVSYTLELWFILRKRWKPSIFIHCYLTIVRIRVTCMFCSLHNTQ